ncbi:acylphosphatase [Streptomyces sp. BE20]|uniref:acylphosphatase n=1 Tax=Streptomyces sp. BE20 TaxID=3002525 RepID=UPI002E7697C3|nr:acylphosphatase [Streptomyces sp. BE20]MEE1826667.1 acylphosphatase [Streptomyces sp. BE20]
MHGRDAHSEEPVRVTAWVRGKVQQVGFRWWTRARALEIGLTGYASNLGDGRVQVVAEGVAVDCEHLLALLRGAGTPGRVAGVTEIWTAVGTGYEGFEIR